MKVCRGTMHFRTVSAVKFTIIQTICNSQCDADMPLFGSTHKITYCLRKEVTKTQHGINNELANPYII